MKCSIKSYSSLVTVNTLANAFILLKSILRLSKMIAIIGAGWYGCIAADFFLSHNIDFVIFDQSGIFTGSSYNNQNRLHIGFHYARSKLTRDMCVDSYHYIKSNFPDLIKEVDNNYYAISNQSLIDLGTYQHIFDPIGYEVIDDPMTNITNVQGVISVNECFIEHKKARKYWEDRLSAYLQIKKVELDNLDNYDLIIDRTNNAFELIPNTKIEYSLSLVYRNRDKLNLAVTIVDGDFCSLYPYDLDNKLYTLTSVLHTPIDDNFIDLDTKRKLMEEEANMYFKEFFSDFEYVDHFISKKVKPKYKDDRKTLLISKTNEKIYSVACCKISRIKNWREFFRKRV